VLSGYWHPPQAITKQHLHALHTLPISTGQARGSPPNPSCFTKTGLSIKTKLLMQQHMPLLIAVLGLAYMYIIHAYGVAIIQGVASAFSSLCQLEHAANKSSLSRINWRRVCVDFLEQSM
jgi:hypothetical protein